MFYLNNLIRVRYANFILMFSEISFDFCFQEPVWLNMMNIRDKQEEIAERFITTLMKAMDIFEKKEES